MGVLKSLNPAGVKLLGCDSIDGVLGQPMLDFLENSDEVMAILANTLSEASREGGYKTVDVPIVSKYGRATYCEIASRVMVNKEGEVVGLEGLARDITDRKRAEETSEETEQALKKLVEKLRLAQEELSTPVVQIWDSILALPLIGVIDNTRGQQVMEVLLRKIVDTQSEVVILDVTGVSSMDTEVTNNLVKTIHSTSLLGAKCAITGIRPEVAQSMSHLGVDMSKLVIKSDMQDGLRWGLDELGWDVTLASTSKQKIVEILQDQTAS